MITRRRIAMLAAEFFGAGMLTTIVLTLGKAQETAAYFIALAVGLAVAGLIVSVGFVSGGHFNPAISLGLWTVRRSSALRTVGYITAQLLGAVGAYWLFTYLFNGTVVTSGDFDARVLVAETLGTMILAIGVAAVVFRDYQGGQAAFTVGAALTVGVLVASIASAGVLNPSVALGVFGTPSWIWSTYVLGPVIGAVIGFNLYALLFATPRELIKTQK